MSRTDIPNEFLGTLLECLYIHALSPTVKFDGFFDDEYIERSDGLVYQALPLEIDTFKEARAFLKLVSLVNDCLDFFVALRLVA
jgi:hypothetical protein